MKFRTWCIAAVILLWLVSVLIDKRFLPSKRARMPLRPRDMSEHPLRPAYSIWLDVPTPQASRLAKEISKLADKFQGTHHQPHVTLCGAIYTDDEAEVLRTAESVAWALKPITLEFSRLVQYGFSRTGRWRSGLALNFCDNSLFFDSSKLCTSYFAQASFSGPSSIDEAQSTAHATILYDWTGQSLNRLSELYPANGSEFSGSADFTATSFSVVYTPLRDFFSNAQDMQAVVAQWRPIRKFTF